MKKEITPPRRAPKHWAYRFWSKVDVREVGECWPWLGSVNRKGGYGTLMSYQGSEKLYSHRVAYSLHKREPDQGAYILHKCDNPICCNPYHLREGTHADNMADMAKKGRSSRKGASMRYYGERHHNCKISDEEVREVRRMIADGWKNKDIAPIFGVTANTISQIKTRVTRKNVAQ